HGGDSVVERLPKTRPAGAAVELGVRREQIELAGRTLEDALAVLVVERARERPFRGFLAQHLILIRREQLLPLLVGVRDLEGLGIGRVAAARDEGSEAENTRSG